MLDILLWPSHLHTHAHIQIPYAYTCMHTGTHSASPKTKSLQLAVSSNFGIFCHHTYTSIPYMSRRQRPKKIKTRLLQSLVSLKILSLSWYFHIHNVYNSLYLPIFTMPLPDLLPPEFTLVTYARVRSSLCFLCYRPSSIKLVSHHLSQL